MVPPTSYRNINPDDNGQFGNAMTITASMPLFFVRVFSSLLFFFPLFIPRAIEVKQAVYVRSKRGPLPRRWCPPRRARRTQATPPRPSPSRSRERARRRRWWPFFFLHAGSAGARRSSSSTTFVRFLWQNLNLRLPSFIGPSQHRKACLPLKGCG